MWFNLVLGEKLFGLFRGFLSFDNSFPAAYCMRLIYGIMAHVKQQIDSEELVDQDKISISTEEIAGISLAPTSPSPASPALRPDVPLFAKIALAPLVLVLPLLSVIAIAIRLYVRRSDARVAYAWIRYTSSLLIVSGLVTTALLACGLLWPRGTLPAAGLDSHLLDNMTAFPAVQQPRDRTTEELASDFKKIVFIVTRQPKWNLLPRENLFRAGFGSGVLVYAGEHGYLVLSSRHVIDGEDWQQSRPYSGNVALGREEGDFTSAKIAGRHRSLDLILLRVERHSGKSSFVQPVVDYSKIPIGERILVFGHPEGLFFSVSDGIVSRKDGTSIIQITAPVAPGTSGGPAYDFRGGLLGVVNAMYDKKYYPQAENLNFAVRADSLLRPDEWSLDPQGSQLMKEFLAASQIVGTKVDASKTSPSKTAKPTSSPINPKQH